MSGTAWETKPGNVRVDALRHGDRFTAINGQEYEYDRVDGSSSGVHWVNGTHGARTCFGGSALVTPLATGGAK